MKATGQVQCISMRSTLSFDFNLAKVVALLSGFMYSGLGDILGRPTTLYFVGIVIIVENPRIGSILLFLPVSMALPDAYIHVPSKATYPKGIFMCITTSKII